MPRGNPRRRSRVSDPHQAREARRYANPIPSREFIIEVLAEQAAPLKFDRIAERLELTDPEQLDALSRRLWEDFERFQQRDLTGYSIEYLFLDGIYESVRKLAGIKEAILLAWGIQRDGRKVLLSLRLGNKESYGSWLEMLRDMVKRGLRIPVSITSDGAPGAIKAIEAIFPRSLRIRCWVHRMKNFSSKVPPVVWPELKAELYQIRDASSYEQGKRLAESFIQRYKKTYPTLVNAVSDDLEALLSHLKLPIRHRKSVRTTNLIERRFVEQRRSTKVIPGLLDRTQLFKAGVLGTDKSQWAMESDNYARNGT